MQTISFIGAGNVASHLVSGFVNVGFPIRQIFSRRKDRAVNLAQQANAEAIDQWHQIDDQVDIIIVAIKDDVLQSLGEYWQTVNNPLVVHTSGSVESTALKQCSRHFGVFYPLQTFTKDRVLDLSRVPFCIETNNDGNREVLLNLCKALNAKGVHVDDEARQNLHLAATIVNNFGNELLNMAAEKLGEQDLPFDMLQALGEETVAKAFNLGPGNAQTGPAKRGDWSVVENHMKKIVNDKQRTLYQLISENIYNRYNSQ